MTRLSAINGLEYGVALCDITKTMLVHIPVEEAKEILELLKAQEPIEPDVDVDTWICSQCGHRLEHQEMLGTNVLFDEQY